MNLPLIDSHAHVVPSAYGEELPQVLERAWGAGLTHIVVIGSGYGPESMQAAIDVARWDRRIRAVVGIHPHDARHATPELLSAASKLAADPAVCAYGEIGLDYHYDNSPRGQQRQAFADQLSLAEELGLPVVIHTREANADTLDILDAHPSTREPIIHCFTGTPAFASALLDRGAILSISGVVTFPKAEVLREAVALIPPHRLLVETDSPFLAPVPKRGTRNEPANVVHVLHGVAEVLKMDPAALAEQTSTTSQRVFGLESAV